jgi:peptide/nickel transport system permease protein
MPSIAHRLAAVLLHAGSRLRDPQMSIGVAVIVVYVVLAFTAQWWISVDPLVQDVAHRLEPPSLRHPFGTDTLGRDVFSRVIYGAQISIPAAAMVVALGTVIGTGIGAVAGFSGGVVDEILMRVTDMVLAFPVLVLTMAVAAAFGPSLLHGIIALVAVWWPQYVRVSRGLVLSHKGREYVAASYAAGRRADAILMRVILPGILPTILVMAAIDIGRAILMFSILGFLGVGARPPTPEWGVMVSEGAIVFDQWWVATFPALAILILVFAFNLIGDALRDAMDPWAVGRN